MSFFSLERFRSKVNYQMINRIMRFDRFFEIVMLTYEFSRYYKDKYSDV